MNREEYLTLINETGYVDSKGEAQRFMDESSYRAQQIVSEINNKYHPQSEIQELMSELTQEKVSETLKIFPPIYTDFARMSSLTLDVAFRTKAESTSEIIR